MPPSPSLAYRILDARSLPAYLAGVPAIAARLGGHPSDWTTAEASDGNVNLVFLVGGPRGGVCVKQALPYVRMVGESWPLGPERANFEYRALVEHRRHVGARVPAVYHHDGALYLNVLERLEPHIILRRGLVAGIRYPRLAADMAEYLARSLFFTSSLGMPAAEKKRLMAFFCGNIELCRIMEDVYFTEPYTISPRNRWTTPELDELAAEIRGDAELKIATSRLKLKYMTQAEALIHGDLHAGSIMVTHEDTRVIDQEFAFFGPMSFDVGNIIANLLLSFFSQDGHSSDSDPREGFRAWLLDTVETLWSQFHDQFIALWQSSPNPEAFEPALFADPEAKAALQSERREFLRGVFRDALGFGGMEIFRRVFGVAHVIDLEDIADRKRRARCEASCIRFARDLIVGAGRYRDIRDVVAAARRFSRGATSQPGDQAPPCRTC